MRSIQHEALGSDPEIFASLPSSDHRRVEPSEQVLRHLRPRDEQLATPVVFEFEKVIDRICGLPWEKLSDDELLRIAMAYYYFSVQFRENLEVACKLYPADEKLKDLRRGECDTSNLSPWENVAAEGEAMNHDEFMRRLLALQTMADVDALACAGDRYLVRVRAMDDLAKAKSIASYEDGGLENVFSAILRAPSWKGDGQRAFRHFLEKHIEFDSDSDGGHGALSRHIPVDDTVLSFWLAFEDILRSAVAAFANTGTNQPAEQGRLLP
jgi:hypothetical protein